MNPNAFQMAYLADVHARSERIAKEHRDRLHRAAKARRAKAKRGGKK